MARTPLHLNRPVRTAATLASVAGIALLAGCSAGAAEAETAITSDTSSSTTSEPTTATTADSAGGGASGAFVAGTYEGDGSYSNPRGNIEKVHVSMTIAADGTIESVDVTGTTDGAESAQYQGLFISGISDEVVGKKIDELNVTVVSGSSLTSGGFMQAVDAIEAEAAA
ncbi:FMN-binding protein [Microbacterium sp. ZW T5_56]|uniref:FMN-binding protein n=1 Tax=Microbacterium sp. ZW T5_56 TaxID=3378081 RepID=UPI003853452B